jgi:cyclic beta-1,2-glucan synthetase
MKLTAEAAGVARAVPSSISSPASSAVQAVTGTFRRRFNWTETTEEPPIRAELFGIERLEQHAESLAAAQHVMSHPTNDNRLQKRLRDNERVLREAYLVTASASRDSHSIAPAADWLVDNFHVVQEQVSAIRIDLPPGFHKQLPKLNDGPFAGYPRVYGLSWAFVAHTDSRFDPQMLSRFLRAYQRVQPLTIGELWAVAIALRVVLVENLRRLAEGMVRAQASRHAANDLADRLLGSTAEAAGDVLATIATPLPTAFSAQLVRRLREEDPGVAPALRWLDKALASQATTTERIVDIQQQREGSANVTIRNVITSMRLISSIDWRELFESVSPVDAVLRDGSDFASQDFATRELYRHAIEAIARGSRRPETEIAACAVAAARTAATGRVADPGYYLIAKGRPGFEAEVNCRPTIRNRLLRVNETVGIAGYGAVVVAIATIILGLVAGWTLKDGSVWNLAELVLFGLIPASDAAMALTNYAATNRFSATRLPGLELEGGVPPSLRTLVAMPTMLTSLAEIAELVRHLEVHHLANSDDELSFALVSDWADAATETMPGDDALLQAATDGVAALNARYGPAPAGSRFLLLHRRRRWNPAEGKWIGWERKRGKLHELNRLLRGADDTSFVSIVNQVPAGVRYVIVLDADTRLPRDTARRLVGKMAHPLNQPDLDAGTGRVVDGYAVLQPRVTPALPTGRDGSVFQRLFANASGMDPYACVVSDVYQDLFGEGSYCGKGIYDVDMFEAAMKGRISDNTVLSHDLLEGTFARAGLISDIELIDEFPARYDVAVSRQYRWARGDWQLLPWILGRRSIPLVGRWKMLDNLRRSLSAPAAFAALVIGWTLPSVDPPRWTVSVLAAIAIQALIPFVTGILPRRRGLARLMHLRAVAEDLQLALSQIALLVAFLPHQAWVMGQAIVLTLYRLLITRRHLLEWVTASQAKISPSLDLIGFYRGMVGGIALTIGAALLLTCCPSAVWPIGTPFIVLWLLSPVIARRISEPSPPSGIRPATAGDIRALRLIARRTWSFFETFVTAEDNMLPPDNFQEDPKPVIAHRTSPTNIGLYLLSASAAADFGWITILEATERLEATFASMTKMERHLGHFYNWYGTLNLRPLEPRYISSVDSGNLAGHLIALWNACTEMAEQPLIAANWRMGIGDPLALLLEAIGDVGEDPHTPDWQNLIEALKCLTTALEPDSARPGPETPDTIAAELERLMPRVETIPALVRKLCTGQAGNPGFRRDGPIWADALLAAARGQQRNLAVLAPWAMLVPALAARMPTLAELPALCERAIATGENTEFVQVLQDSAQRVADLSFRLLALGKIARGFFHEMNFSILFDGSRELLSIGYRVGDGSLDPNDYDLLASEARLTSFIAIAKGDLPTRHWFRLGRAMIPVGSEAVLVSWSGSMFEYLMPSLVMRAPNGSLLERSNREVVRQQIKYGAARDVPWGASESAYNARDLEFTYQYSSFGVPSLGLKRGVGDSTVIAPYATALAAMIDPGAAAANFARMADAGGRGQYGWYEALDYTKSRLPAGMNVAVVRAFMAHHQGMTILAIAEAIGGRAMRRRFHSEPMVQATELLLQERMPHDVAIAKPMIQVPQASTSASDYLTSIQRRYDNPHAFSPRTHLMSNGRYAVMLTSAGSGYSRWRDIAVTRWQEDVTRDSWGSHVFLRDRTSGTVWSAGYQPSGVEPGQYDVVFSEGRAEIIRRDGMTTTRMEVAVSSEDDAEVRRISVTNHGPGSRDIEITSYAELVLAPQAADDAHPVFSKMFVETAFEAGTLLATRRRRSHNEPEIWAAHLAVTEGETVGDPQFETDRARFLGRGRTVRAPIALATLAPLSGTAGTVLDPVFSLRRLMRVPSGKTVRIAFWTMVAGSRGAALDIVDRHQDAMAFDRATMLAWTQAQVQLRHLGLDSEDANVFQRIASRTIYADATLRPANTTLQHGDGAASLLWQHGISGDLPIVLVTVAQESDLDLVRRLLLGHEYWLTKQISVDLVILNTQPTSYAQEFQHAIQALVDANRLPPGLAAMPGKGAIFVLRADLISDTVRNLLFTAARAVFGGHRGSLSEQLARALQPDSVPPPPRRVVATPEPRSSRKLTGLAFANGFGGFADDGREYVIVLDDGQVTPAPWINVISNDLFGFHVSAEGSGSTWSLNSQQNHLTPWSNDPVSDPPGEVIYVRDEDTGELWGPTALPIHQPGARHVARHGQGYSRFEHTSHGIALNLLQFVPIDDPVKISRLTVTNQSGRPRRLSVTVYVEWVLGATRATAPFIVTSMDPETGALFARCPWNTTFGQRVAFADLSGRQTSWSGDRRTFIGRNGMLDNPLALATGAPLGNVVGAGLDPCGALQTRLVLPPGGTAEVVSQLGQAATQDEARALIAKQRAADATVSLAAVTRFWDDTLGTVQVKTPDPALDIMLNRWLLYQTLSCRVWARAAFYQASGAYGFRDQLQDVMALCLSRPALARAQLLRAASRQFLEGDVQHWWLPESGLGIRTRISDDRIWLGFVVTHYVTVTGDTAVLREEVPFLEGPALAEHQGEAFFSPTISDRHATLFEHCALALDQSLSVGAHGLPLMGTGDWNDGMNQIGEQGKGESIWVGWLLVATLIAFADLADSTRAATWRQHAVALREALERDGWDGDWYRRAFFDDGTALGSAQNDECRIDSIAQSWSVISGAADPAHAVRAMAAVERELVRHDDALVLLFAPPFDKTALEPGYIKGYPPGIRENGGQYTHGAIWSIIAFAMLGDGDKAGALFSLINPINHALSADAARRYAVEPYAIAADVYSVPPHVGRGGWTWYTGSAGWIYRAGVERILGLRVQASELILDPCIPRAWPGFDLTLRHGTAQYVIRVENPSGVSRGVTHAELDGMAIAGNKVRLVLVDDGKLHKLLVVLG